MELKELYIELCSNPSFYNNYHSIGKGASGKIFAFIGTNCRALLTKKGNEYKGFGASFKVIKNVEGIKRSEWIQSPTRANQEKQKQQEQLEQQKQQEKETALAQQKEFVNSLPTDEVETPDAQLEQMLANREAAQQQQEFLNSLPVEEEEIPDAQTEQMVVAKNTEQDALKKRVDEGREARSQAINNMSEEQKKQISEVKSIVNDYIWPEQVNTTENATNQANVLMEVAGDKVKAACESAKQNPAEENSFRQLRLNQWVKQAVRWMPMEKWDKCRVAIDTNELEGRVCYGGLDLSSTTDITAFVLVFPPLDDEGKYIVLPYFWIPEENIALRVNRDHVPYDLWQRQGYLETTEGNVVHYGYIEKFIEKLGERFHIREIAFDRWGAVQMVQNLEGMGFTVVPFGQGFKDMSPPSKELMKLVLEQKIAHDGHPVLRWMMDNIYIRTDPAGNIKPDKEKSTEKIDGAVATIMALDRAIRCGNDKSESVYDTRGILFI